MSTEIEILQRRLEREIAARKEAESILEKKALELYNSNEKLQQLNQSLEHTIEERTRELANSKRQFQSLVESAGDIIYNADAKGYFTYVNPVTSRILGYGIDELIGKHYTELIREDKVEEVREYYINILREKTPASYLEFPVYSKKGEVFWLGQRVQIDFSDPDDIEITAVARDITALMNARQAIEESEKKYRSLINNMELGLLEVNEDGVITKAYDWFCDMTGYTAEELIGKNPIEVFVRPEERHIIIEQEESRKRGQTGIYEIQMRKKSGEYIWVAISGAPFYDSYGNLAGSMGIHLDITAHKRLQADLETAKEAAISAQQAEKEFLAHMSHEIRTPLNAILGMANLLNTTRLDKLQESYVEDIRYAADTLHGLISDVLDISKIEAGEVDVVESDVDLSLAISMLCKTLDFRVKERGNGLSYTISDEVPQHILADKNFINQILYNLVYNAIKFTQNGSISITVTLNEKQDDNIVLNFEVADTGIGIRKERIQHVFDRYKQETKDTAKKYGGTGLGLTITRKLVELHGGAISVESDEGHGAAFTFTLRVKQGQNYEAKLAENNEEKKLDNIKILIAEDNDLNLKYIQTILNQWGATFEIARNGEQAVEMSQKDIFDVILMDMHMPVMDGYEAAIKIRADKSNPNNNAKILALTASALLDEKRKARKAGMDDHLTKPFTPDALYSFIQQHISLQAREETIPQTVFDKLQLPDIINKKTLAEFYVEDKEYAQQMATFYLDIISTELGKANDLLATENYNGVVGWIHKLAPNFVMVGLPQYTERFKSLEAKMKEQGSLDGFKEDIVSLLEEVAKANKAVEQLNEALQL